ncbi:MAG: hypothetical protein II844_09385 [Prevotella sp.]|nr:hypothetical protein [Prevotella sp.]
MKPLNKTQQMIFAAGAVMMVLGVGGVVLGAPLGLTFIRVATVVFAIGAVAFAAMQMMQTYDGKDIVIRRLRRIMVIGDMCFILAALLMLESNLQILFPLVATTVDGYNAWVHYVYNNWVVALLVAAILEMYTTHRISSELKK